MRTNSGALARLSGELLVIVVGVLIALWADGWVTQRGMQQVEAARIEALRLNLTETIARVAAARAEAEQASETLRALASTRVGAAVADSLLADGLLFGTADFNPEMNVYEDLKSSGELALLRNDRLRGALARMDASLERVRLAQADLLSVQQLTYDPFAIAELDLVRLIGPELLVETDGGAPSMPPDLTAVRKLAVFKLNMVVDLLELYDEAEATLAEALEAATTGPE